MDAATATSTLPAALFADLCDYTRITEELGDAAAARIAVDLQKIARGVARTHHGRVVKTLGDGVHLHFTRSADAVRASLALLGAIASAELPRARVGVNAGPMVEAAGDYYGRAVNIAARIAAHAAPGEVLVGETVATGCGADARRFDRIGPVRLKGVSADVALYRVLRDATASASADAASASVAASAHAA